MLDRYFAQSGGVGTFGRADHQNGIAAFRQSADGFLAVAGGVTDIAAAGQVRPTGLQFGHDGRRIVNAQGGLGQKGRRRTGRLPGCQCDGVGGIFDYFGFAVELAQRTFDLGVIPMADQDDAAAFAPESDGLAVNAFDQRTRRIDCPQTASGRLAFNRRSDTVGAENQDGARRHVFHLADEIHALLPQFRHHHVVVHDLVQHVDGLSGRGGQGGGHRVERPADAGAEPSRRSQIKLFGMIQEPFSILAVIHYIRSGVELQIPPKLLAGFCFLSGRFIFIHEITKFLTGKIFMFGYYRVAAASPRLRVADPDGNAVRILELVRAAEAERAAAVVFPELCITGYTCADLFFQQRLQDKTEAVLTELAHATVGIGTVVIVGAPLAVGNALYNCAVVIHRGAVRGVVPKTLLPNYREFYDQRWFASGRDLPVTEVLFKFGTVPFGTRLLFDGRNHFRFGVEICEDLWGVEPPSGKHCLAGALLTFNPSASNDLVGKAEYRRDLVRQQSGRCLSGYVYASAGVDESTTDVVFGGHLLIAENGRIAAENERFQRDGEILYADLDLDRLWAARSSESSYSGLPVPTDFRTVALTGINQTEDLRHTHLDPHPFVPSARQSRDQRCAEIFHIQSAGLAKRLEHTGGKKMVIGISGGLDSTLALLVGAETCRLLGRPNSDLITVTMPGFGTTDRTHGNAVKLCRELGTELREVDIREACKLNFRDIGHDPAVHDVTYENVQARERTLILMNLANHEHGLLLGTGDLSEIALGWSTYNGDHMSMYAVNCGVPKTLIRYLIRWVADHSSKELQQTLLDVIDTPVSPELLPKAADGQINQKTEDIIGPYELHDFFLYHTVKYGAPPDKVRYLAGMAFAKKYDAPTIARWHAVFVKRFFAQQFKRSCIPDGPKVGTICLSPRGDWRMPSDAVPDAWLD